jgi:hypothetical protein
VLAVDSPLDDLGLLTLARAGSDVLITHDVAESATTESPHNDRT